MKPATKITVSEARKFKENPFNTPYYFFKNDLRVLMNLNNILPQSFKEYLKSASERKRRQLRKLDQKGKKELKKFIDFIEETKDTKKFQKKSMTIKHKKLAEILAGHIDMFIFSKRFNMFIREMSLVYLITEFEQYLGKTLRITFLKKPEILKSSKKQISYEELFTFRELEDLKEKILEREINSIINQDIDDINNYLDDHFGLDLSKLQDWKKFKECFYRRNILIHNNCYPNEIYRKKTGYKGKRARLSITKRYLFRGIRSFDVYSKSIRDFFTKKIT